MSTTVYTANASFGTASAGFRGYLTYSVSSTNTTTTVTWKIGIQGRHNYGYTFTGTLSGGASKTISGSLSSNPGSTWTTIKTASGTASFTRGTSAATKTFKISVSGPKEGQYSGTQTVSKSVSITVPARASYTVSYNANGGSGAPSSQTKYYDTNLTLSSTRPTRSGYTFLGWNTSASATSASIQPGAVYSSNAALALYAIWSKTIAVTYDANGGTAGTKTSDSATIYNSTTSNTFTLPTEAQIPTRANYNFLGWSTSPSAGSPTYTAGGPITLSANTTLYAVWELAYIVPQITGLLSQRSNSSGTGTDDGTYINVAFAFALDTIQSPSLSYIEISVKPASDDWDDSTTQTTTLGAGTTSPVSITIAYTQGQSSSCPGGFAINTAYDVRIKVADTIGSTVVYDIISTAFFTLDFPRDGHGVSIGAPHSETQDTFEISMTPLVALDYSNPDSDGHMQSGADADLYNALLDLGWVNDVIVVIV